VIDGTEISRGLGVPEEGIGKDANRAAGGADVLDFAAGDPVIDGASTDPDHVTRARNGNRLPFKHTFGTIGVH